MQNRNYHDESLQQDQSGTHSIHPIPRISLQAFCESADVIDVLQEAASDRRMGKAHVKVHPGGILAAVDFYESAPTPNLIILESRLETSTLLKELDNLSNVCDQGTKVIIIGHENDVDLYKELMRRGISEYLVWPLQTMEFLSAVSKIYNEDQSKPIGKTIAFIGSRGGVGSSTIAHNVAWSLSTTFATDTVLSDMDLSFGTANLDFNQDPAQGITDVVNAADRLDDVFLDRILTKCTERLSLLASPSTLERTIDYSEDSFEPLMNILKRIVPITVIDLPDIWTSWVRKTLIDADEIVITATPDLASLRNAKNLVDFLKAARPNDKSPYLILNKVNTPKRREIDIIDFQEALNLQPIASIPFDPEIFGLAANNGQMIEEISSKSELVTIFDLTAQLVTGRAELKKPKKSGLSPFLDKILSKKRA